jgi:hypothetical protein
VATNTRNPRDLAALPNAFWTSAAAGPGAKSVVAEALAALGEVAATQSTLIA